MVLSALAAHAPALQEKVPWDAGDWLVVIGFAAFVGFALLGLLRLRRIKREGMDGHRTRVEAIGPWTLDWPDWWPSPASDGGVYRAGPLDHDGRLTLSLLSDDDARMSGDDFLRSRFQSRGHQLDEWDPEEADGKHGTIHIAEGRGDVNETERAYFWLARVPGPTGSSALLLEYRASVLYGLADGFWLQSVATRARTTDAS